VAPEPSSGERSSVFPGYNAPMNPLFFAGLVALILAAGLIYEYFSV
jgi:hypothetical protein